MIKSIKFPLTIIILVYLSQLFVFLLNILDIYNSYVIDYVQYSSKSFLVFNLFYLSLIIFVVLFSKFKFIRVRKSKFNPKRVKLAIRMLSLLGLLFLLLSISDVFSNYSLKKIIILGNQGKLRSHVNFSSGYTVQYVLLIISSIIGVNALFEIKKVESDKRILRKYRNEVLLLLIINSILIFLFSTVLMSRIILIQYIIAIVVTFMSHTKLEMRKLVTIGALSFFFLVITNGYRDFKVQGYLYTNSPINWGFHRIIDYYLSTLNYSLDIIDNTFNLDLTYFFPIFNRLFGIDVEGIPKNVAVASAEYTNIGGIGALYFNLNYLIIVYTFVLSILINFFKSIFKDGNIVGILVYPLVLYSILELARMVFIPSLIFNYYVVISIVVALFLSIELKQKNKSVLVKNRRT